MNKPTQNYSFELVTKGYLDETLATFSKQITKQFTDQINYVVEVIGDKFDEQDARFDKHDRRFDHTDRRLDIIEALLVKHDEKLENIDQRLNNIEESISGLRQDLMGNIVTKKEFEGYKLQAKKVFLLRDKQK